MQTVLNQDELFLIAIQLDLPDLLNFCNVNSQTRKLCNKDLIWNYKLNKNFPEYANSFNDMTKKKKYKLLYKLNILKNELNLGDNLVELYNSKELHLSYNKIRIIPKEIDQLKNLEILDLSNNEIKIIPGELGRLYNLKLLLLDNNKIESIPEEIGRLYNLQDLFLIGNQIKTIPKEIKDLPNLTIHK